jgi:hypothetical protein
MNRIAHSVWAASHTEDNMNATRRCPQNFPREHSSTCTQKLWSWTLIVGVIALSACGSAPSTSIAPTATPVPAATLTGTASPTASAIPIPTITATTPPPYDDFSGASLDREKWAILLDWEYSETTRDRIAQDGRVRTTVVDKIPNSSSYLEARWGFEGDFDIQVDFEIGEGWDRPLTGHLDSALLGVKVDDASFHITRIRSSGIFENFFMAWSERYSDPAAKATTASSGRLRLIRQGTTLDFLYDTGAGWERVGYNPMFVPAGFARVYLGNASIEAALEFTTYFDNFVINAGEPVFR